MPEREPDQAPVDESTQSEELGDEDLRVDQQNVGIGVEQGGGEFPDPDTPPSARHGAPGEPGVSTQEHGRGQFQEAYDSVPDEVAASGSVAHADDDEDEPEDERPPT